jgi:hypothetical protein
MPQKWMQPGSIACAAFVIALVAGCTFTVENPNSPASVVKRMYEAQARNDAGAYIDTLVPEARAQPQLNVQGLLNSLSLGAGGISFGLSEIAKFEFTQLSAQVLEEQADTALVQIRGNLRLTGVIIMEMPICGEHETRMVDGKWLVDVLSSTQIERMQRISARQQQEMNNLAASANPPLQLIDRRAFIIVLNLCERPSKAIA